MCLSSQNLPSHFCRKLVWYTLLPAPSLALSQHGGSWRLVVAGLGDSSGGYSFTTHCAAGLLFDAGVVPLAAGEMSCLLPFPYTPKPNEQRGARTRHFLHPCYMDLPFSSTGLLPDSRSSVLRSLRLILVTRFFFLHSSHDPSFKPSIYPTLFSWSLFSQSQRSPQYVASPLRGWRPVTWHGLRGEGQNCHSPMAYKLSLTNTHWWVCVCVHKGMWTSTHTSINCVPHTTLH